MRLQLQEEISDDIKWLITVKKVLHSGQSKFQSVELVDSGPFKKASSFFAHNLQQFLSKC